MTPAQFAADVRLRFAEAARRRQAVERAISLAGRSLRLRFAGQEIANAAWPALRHLSAPADSGPAAVFEIWDSGSSGVPPPPPPRNLSAFGAGFAIDGLRDAQWILRYDTQRGQLIGFNLASRNGFYWTADVAQWTVWDRACPFKILMHTWAQSESLTVLHAAAVAGPAGAAILCGVSGSGKSTVAVWAAAKGARFLGDDICLLSPEPPFTVHSLYAAAKWRGPSAPPPFSPLPGCGAAEFKSGLDLADDADRIVLSARPLALIAVCADRSGSARLEPASRAEALRSLAPSSLFQIPGREAEGLRAMAALTRSVPTYRLHTGSRADRSADPVIALLQNAGATAARASSPP